MGVVTTYRATASGHRLAQQSGSGTTEVTLREGATVLGSVTVNATGTPTVWHFNVLAGAQAIGRQPSTGSRRYYHTDLLGSVRAVVTGPTVVESTDYDPWGVVLAGRTLSSGTKEGFTGQPRDLTTGLDDFGARAYLSALGRWGSVDPAAGVMPEWSPYAYVLNNPLGDRDADGQLPVSKLFKLAKAIYRGGDLAAAFADNLQQVRTLADAEASDGAKAWAGVQLLISVASPVDVSDVRGAARLVGRAVGRADDVGDAARATGTATRIGGDATQGAATRVKPDFIVSSDGAVVHSSPDRVRASLEGAGFEGRIIQNPAGTETGTIHNIPGMKMDARVMNGGPHHPARVVTSRQGTPQPVNPATGSNFGNVPKTEQRARSHIVLP